MAEVRTILRQDGNKIEVFVTAEELMKALKCQDSGAFSKVVPNYEEYCLTFKKD